ncbi:hypothetical protein ACIBCM_13470 [Streptomyces sp. NPDC051018]|uniref:hypothetical protein n=1 Tax=Streptomyces sp. NPDC051018 TaxID=3365639 RepID=UPI00378788F8
MSATIGPWGPVLVAIVVRQQSPITASAVDRQSRVIAYGRRPQETGHGRRPRTLVG